MVDDVGRQPEVFAVRLEVVDRLTTMEERDLLRSAVPRPS